MGIGIEPIGEMVLIAMENAPEKTESGLLLPEEARDKMNVGKVEAVGPDAKSVGVGDRVKVMAIEDRSSRAPSLMN